MNSKRSYLDSVNAGRPRRQSSSLEEITRTLDSLGEQLGRGYEASRQRRPEPPARQHGYDEPSRPRRSEETDPMRHFDAHAPRRAIRDMAQDFEASRRNEDGFAAVSKIASEIKGLRDELRQQMNSGLRREFEALKSDLQRAVSTAPASTASTELGAEFERLSDAIHTLSERGDDRGVSLLRLELEEVKAALDELAREDTVRSVGKRWDEFDRKWDRFENRVTEDTRSRDMDPAFAALTRHLEQIGDAVNNLPESLSLRTLEDKVRILANAVDQFSTRQTGAVGDHVLEALEARLDEITRAIAASATVTRTSDFDPEPFERIEARISSLARQIEDFADIQPSADLIDRLNLLSNRVEDIAQRVDVPDHAVERLADQIAVISSKLDHAPATTDMDVVFDGLERRFDELSTLLERRQGDALAQGQSLFRDLERRLDEVNERLDTRHAAQDAPGERIISELDQRFADFEARMQHSAENAAQDDTVNRLEARLEEIATKIGSSAGQVSSIDPQLIQSLESQVATLSAHIQSPGRGLPEMEDIAPRLDHIEKTLSNTREDLLEAARQAASEAMRTIESSPSDHPGVAELAQDLKALDMLTRRSDERNTKTFEAIHDTLLKIVDRLGALESTPPPAPAAAAAKMSLDVSPSIDAADDVAAPSGDGPGELRMPRAQDLEVAPSRSPAQAAAEAATAALDREGEPASDPQASLRSMFGGLTKAFTGRRDRGQADVEPQEPTVGKAPVVEPEGPVDPTVENQPIEPGSAPDLNAIMKRVRDERSKPTRAGGSGGSDAAKSDFIAAARRAAQAAAAEAEIKKNGGDGGTKSGFKLGGLSSIRRKPVLLAATAILVVLAGMQLGKAFLGGDGGTPAGEPQLVSEQAPSDPAAEMPALAEEDGDTADIAGDMAPDATMKPARIVGRADDTASGDANPMTGPVLSSADGSPNSGAPVAEAPREPENTEVASIPTSDDLPVAPDTTVGAIPLDAGPIALREAAEAGDPRALFEIGSRYAEGRGVSADMKEAAGWYERAADMGLAPAQYRIGNFYEKGLGVDRDLAKAKTYYQLAAEQGNASAMHNLAVLFAMGADGAKDNESAARWFTEAAEHGVKDSQFNLGILAAKGVGMKQDLEESYKWFALVAKTGDRDAAEKRDEVANALRPEQLTKARAAAELWKAKTVDPEANAVDVPPEWTEGDQRTASVDMKKAIRNIQAILNKNGYDAGPVDGMMGGRTRDAIVAFQKDNGFEPNGIIDEALVRALVDKK